MKYHIGRSWSGTRLEDDCPCEKAPCGLVASANESCSQHSLFAAKTIRQIHTEDDCPGGKMTEGIRYRKRAVEISAFHWTDDEAWGDLLKFANYLVRQDSYCEPFYVYDRLHDTWVEFEYGDYIIKGLQGEFYPCKEDVFEQSYERVFTPENRKAEKYV